MAEPVKPDDPRIKRAVQVLRQILTARAGGEFEIDVQSHFIDWVDLRRKFSQHMLAWQFMTRMTIAVDAGNQLAGWFIEKRKEKGGPNPMHPTSAEMIARVDPLVPAGSKCTAVEKVQVGPADVYMKCIFEVEAIRRRIEASVNPSTRELIGVMPVEQPPATPLTASDPGAAPAETIAWDRIEQHVLRKVGNAGAQNVRKALKLTFHSATADKAQIKRFVFNVFNRLGECDVFLDADFDQVLGWYVDAFETGATEEKISDKDAVKLASPELLAKKDVAGPDVSHTAMQNDKAIVIHWQHRINDIPIAGDFTTVMLNATTGVPFGVSRKWREVPPEVLSVKAISAQEALAATERQRKQIGIPDNAKGKVIAKAVVEIAQNPDRPSPLRNVLVWRIGYKAPNDPRYTEIHVDARNGEIVQVTGY